MSTKQVNGVQPQSKTVNHVASYPLVDELLKIYQQNSLGAKSINLYKNMWATFAQPVLPYLQTPISIATPYLERVDQFGNSTLDWTDNHFPVVKQTNLKNIREKAVGAASFPFIVAGQTKNYVFNTYSEEHGKVGGQGLVKTANAIISTELHIAVDAYNKVIDVLGPRGKQLDERARALASNGQAKVSEYTKQAQQQVDGISEYTKQGQQQVDGLAKHGQAKVDHAKKSAHQTVDASKQKANEAANQK